MSFIQVAGVHVDLESDEQIARAKQLAGNYPRTYEVADFKTKQPSPEYPDNWNEWNMQDVIIPRLYSMNTDQQVFTWVLEGVGKEPGNP